MTTIVILIFINIHSKPLGPAQFTSRLEALMTLFDNLLPMEPGPPGPSGIEPRKMGIKAVSRSVNNVLW